MSQNISRTNRLGMVYNILPYQEDTVINPNQKSKEDTVIIRRQSGSKQIIVKASVEQVSQSWYNWLNGMYIQVAFDYLSADQREFIMTGITPEEWEELFPEEEE